MHGFHRRPAFPLAAAFAVAAALGMDTPAAEIDEGFEGPAVSWRLAESDCNHRVLDHRRSGDSPHRGNGSERFVIEASGGTTLRVALPIGPAAAIDELSAAVWVKSNRPDLRLALRVVLPKSIDTRTGRPIEVLVAGSRSRGTDRWERMEVGGAATVLARQITALRAEHGPAVDPGGAIATELVLELYSTPGRYELAIDDLRATGLVPFEPPAAAPMAVARQAAEPDLPAGLARGVIEVAGLPFFPRAIDHNGEPLEAIAALGFNCIRLAEPAPSELLVAARRCGLWVICPPPKLPDVDITQPESLPVFSTNWDRVLMWDLGSGLAERDVEDLAERARRVRACDFRQGRPLMAAADSGLRAISRHVDLLVARRTVLGTSLELNNFVEWLRERPRLARPGTPVLATLGTEIDPTAAEQAGLLTGGGGRSLAVDPESLVLSSLAAVAAGSRGILYSSASRIDASDEQAVVRALACREMNLKLSLIEPWAASGRFASVAQTSDPEVQAVVIEAARTRIVLLYRVVQGAQIVARRYHGDLPRDTTGLTVIVPGAPEAHQAYLAKPTGLEPLRPKRVTGGVSLSIEAFRSHAVIILSGDPAVTGDMQRRVREMAPRSIESLRAVAARSVADATALAARLPQAALGVVPVANMLAEARAARAAGESLVGSDPVAAADHFSNAHAIAGQIERLAWERGVTATGSMVADALATSDATLAEHWNFVEAIALAAAGPERLAGGGMERIDDLAQSGWRHFALEHDHIRSGVEISRQQPAGGTGALRLMAAAVSKENPVTVVETPPVWITTPEVEVPSGKLLRIEADVFVPKAIEGSVDGLLVFDSLGGPAMAERVGPSKNWRRLVLYRMTGRESASAVPVVVTFALTGLGEAKIDNVSMRIMERAAPGSVPAVQAVYGPIPNPAQAAVGSPALPPFELPGTRSAVTSPAPFQPPAERKPPSIEKTDWPGIDFDWQTLNPFGSSNAPPPGPGGGRIDPFQRGRSGE